MLDILASREAAMTAWRRLGFVDCESWGDPAMRYFERPVADGGSPPWLGLRRGEVALHDHDERWSIVFHHHAEVVRRGLGGQVGGIEHVGSTAVEGLVAKPVVELAVRLTPAADKAKVIASLEARRYVFRGNKNDHGGLLFVAEDQPHRRTVHLHVLRHDDPQWERYLRVRDLLRTDEGARRRYAAFKRELAGRCSEDRGAYTPRPRDHSSKGFSRSAGNAFTDAGCDRGAPIRCAEGPPWRESRRSARLERVPERRSGTRSPRPVTVKSGWPS